MKNNLLIPIAGKSQRFIDRGYSLPKPMITIGGRMMIDLAMDSVDYSESNIIFIVREDHVREFSIDEVLRLKFGTRAQILILDQLTQGTLCTCLLAKDLINKELPTWIWTPDSCMPQVKLEIPDGLNGFLYTFKANNPAHSYCRTEGNLVVEVKEKVVIGENANCGLYGFKDGRDFIWYGENFIKTQKPSYGEYYVAPVFDYMLKHNLQIGFEQMQKFYCLGTPEDVSFFERRVLPVFGDKPIGLCSDHSGFSIKESIKFNTHYMNLDYIDFGCYASKDCDYIDFLRPAVESIQKGICDFVIASCRTANGMVMAANKFKDINAVTVNDEFTAEYAIRHNAANIFCIPERDMTEDKIKNIIKKLIEHTFDGGRFTNRLMKIPNG